MISDGWEFFILIALMQFIKKKFSFKILLLDKWGLRISYSVVCSEILALKKEADNRHLESTVRHIIPNDCMEPFRF